MSEVIEGNEQGHENKPKIFTCKNCGGGDV